MCMAKLEELTSKVVRKSGPGKWLERNYGIRPSGPLQMLGIAKKEKNLFYQPGGAGYSGPAEKTAPKGPAAHVKNIASRKV